MATFTLTTLGPAEWGNLSPGKEVPISVSFAGMASAFTQGALVLVSANPPNPIAVAWLLSQATENSLKAWLCRNGKPKALNDSKVWHDLEELWTLAQADGLEVSSQRPEWLIYLARTHRKPFANRYAEGQVLVMHSDLMPHAQATDQLLKIVSSQLANDCQQ